MKQLKRFNWTDEKIEIFAQIYATNFNSKLVDEDIYIYSNYKGKKVKEKIKQFKKDYKLKTNNNEKN